MYAVVRSGGKQYRVEEKNILTVDKFEAEAGTTMTLGEVFYLGGDDPQWGKPTVGMKNNTYANYCCLPTAHWSACSACGGAGTQKSKF